MKQISKIVFSVLVISAFLTGQETKPKTSEAPKKQEKASTPVANKDTSASKDSSLENLDSASVEKASGSDSVKSTADSGAAKVDSIKVQVDSALRDTSENVKTDSVKTDTSVVAPDTTTGDSLALVYKDIFPEDYTSPFRYLIPTEGDVFYEPGFKLVVYLGDHTPSTIGLLLDDRPTQMPVEIEGIVLTANISHLTSGPHELTIMFLDEKGHIYFKELVRFFVRLPEPIQPPIKTGFKQFSRLQVKSEYRGFEASHPVNSYEKVKLENGNISTESKEDLLAKNADGIVQGVYQSKYKRLESRGKVVLRTRENKYRQPAHRFSGRVGVKPWVNVKGGDVYPMMNGLVLTDTRVRGVQGRLNAVIKEKSFGSVDVVHGISKRKVDPHIVFFESLGQERVDTVAGSYQQLLSAARLGFGGGDLYDFGITLLKASDDEKSLDRLLNDSLFGPSPTDNLVTGLDFRLGFLQDKLQFFADGAVSTLTKNKNLGVPTNLDLSFDPTKLEDFVILNSSTQGVGFLLGDQSGNTDITSFVHENSTYQMGMKLGIESKKFTTETEFLYSHLGYFYHSEGNRFLGSNPEDAWKILQRIRALDNKLALGFEGVMAEQETGFLKQKRLSLKSDIRYAPSAQAPSVWMGLGFSNTDPEKNQFSITSYSQLMSFNSGGFHSFKFPRGKLHTWIAYNFSQSERETLDINRSPISETVKTNIISTSIQYKERGTTLVPRISYNFADNGVQKPTNNLNLGFSVSFFQQKLKVDLDGQVGQYPETTVKNDLKLGESFRVSYRISPHQGIRLEERWNKFGERKTIVANLQYDLYL